MNTGWIKLHRSILEWEWWDDANTMRLFVYCLLMANHEEAKWHGTTIERGSFITSTEHLASGVGISIQQARTALNHLITTGEITSKPTSKGRIITICNYDKYQPNEEEEQQANTQADDKQSTSNQQADNKQITTNKNIENNNNDNNEEKDNLSHSQARAREDAYGGVIQPVRVLKMEIIKEIENQGQIVSSMARLYGLTPEQLTEAVGLFTDKILADGINYKSRSDFKHHFNSWLKLNVKQIFFNDNNNGNNRSPRYHQPQYSPEFLASIAADITSGH